MDEVKSKKEAAAKKAKDEEDRMEARLKREREEMDEAYRREEDAKRKKVSDARSANQQIMDSKKSAAMTT